MRLKSASYRVSNLAASGFLAVALSLSSVVAGADEPPVIGFDAPSYDHAVSLADLEQEPGRWMRTARSNADRELARWELLASGYYPDEAEEALAREAIVSWSDEHIAERYAEWLEDRFFGAGAARLRGIVSEAAGRANRAFLYVCDDEGSVAYDDAGDPVTLDRGDDEAFASDRSAWLELTEDAIGEALSRFDLDAQASLEATFPELAAFTGDDASRYESIAASAAAKARGRVARELDALLAREERLFVARRESDSWSLRRRSEEKAAGSIVEALIAETGGACDAALESLREGVEDASGETNGLDLYGSDWLERFEEQFDRGLERWTDAEERFMVRRLEWERDAATAFVDGASAWSGAYDRLVDERSEWEAEARELLLSGERAFAGASERLESSIARARAEFERDATERGLAGSARASAWADVYIQSGQAAMGAREGAEYWLSTLGSGAPGFGSDGLVAWLDDAEAGASPSRLASISRARDCLGRYDEFMARCVESRDRLIDDFGLAIGSGSGALVDVLAEGVDSQSFCLDEYQVELIRAESVEGYWRSRASIAEAVSDYAEDLSSGRATAGDTATRLATARAAYDEAQADYGLAQSGLSEAGGRIGSASEALAEAGEALEAAGLLLERAASEYSSLMVELVSGGDGGRLRSDLLARYRALIEAAGLSGDSTRASEAELLAAYYGKAIESGFGQAIEEAGEAMRSAIEGIGDEYSLSELARAADAVVVEPDRRYDWTDLGDDSAERFASRYGVSAADPAYASLVALHNHTASVLSGLEDGDERAESIASSLELAGRIARRADRIAEAALEARLDAVSLLGAVDAAAWYGSRAGGALGDLSLEARLRSDESDALRRRLEARSSMELEAIRVLDGTMDEIGASDEAKALYRAYRSLGGDASLEGRRDTLESILELVGRNRSATIEAFSSELESLAAIDPAVGEFARGRGFFVVAGSDLSSILEIGESYALERARAMLAAVDRYGSDSAALERSRYERAASILGDALARLGLPLGNGGGLPSARDIAAAGAVADLSSAVGEAADIAPEWMAAELRRWDAAMIEYAAAKSVAAGRAPGVSADEYAMKAAGIFEAAMALGTSIQGLSGGGDDAMTALYDLSFCDSFGTAEGAAIRREALSRIASVLADTEGELSSVAAIRFGGLLPDHLASVIADASTRRIEYAWSSWDYEATAEIAGLAAGLVARTAYAMESIVFGMLEGECGTISREGLVSLMSPGSDGEASWLGSYYDSEGQDAGAAMESLLAAAAGEEGVAWSVEDARLRVLSIVADSIAPLEAFVSEARARLDDASAPIERYIASCITSTAPDEAYVSWISAVVGLSESYGLAPLVGASDDEAMAAAFMGLGEGAASYYLAFLAGAGRIDDFESLAATASVQEAERGRAIVAGTEACSAYAGDFSGDVIDWALEASGQDISGALAMVGIIEGTRSSDSMEGPFGRWLLELASVEIGSYLAEAGRLTRLAACSSSYDRLIAEADAAMASGTAHWRELLGCEALLEALEADSSSLPEPGAALAMAGSWNDGALVDRSEVAQRLTESLEQGLAAWDGYSASLGAASYDRLDTLVAVMDRHCNDPYAPYDDSSMPMASSDAERQSRAALDAYLAIQSARSLAETRFGELGALAGVIGDDQAMAELARELEAEIESARESQRAAMDEYERAAAALSAAGTSYDDAYERASMRYDSLEEASRAYAIEDAVWRWASSAYLYAADEECSGSPYGDPAGELSYCESSLARASTALAALRGLYDDGRESREYVAPEYRAAYDEYRESYRRLMLVAKAEDALADGLRLEMAANDDAGEAYRAARSALASGSGIDDGFASYLRVGSDGRIRLAYDASFSFSGAMDEGELSSFLYSPTAGGSGSRMADTALDRNLDSLAAWMSSVPFDQARARRWGLARDYVVRRLASSDAAFASLVSYSESAIDDATIGGQRFVLGGSTLSEVLSEYRAGSLAADQAAAYASLAGDEKAMFDTYLALQLTGAMKAPKATTDGSSTYDAFSAWSDRAQYEALEAEAERQIAVCRTGMAASSAAYAGFLAAAAIASAFLITAFLVPGLLISAALAFASITAFGLTMSGVGETRAVYSPAMSDLIAQTDAGVLRMTDGMDACVALRSGYLASCERLAALEGISPSDAACDEASLRASLERSGALSAAEIDELASSYVAYLGTGGPSGHGSLEALSAMSSWTRDRRDDALTELEATYAVGAAEQYDAEEAYKGVYASYIAGHASEDQLTEAARYAFGPETASEKAHLSRLEAVLRELPLNGESIADGDASDAAVRYSIVTGRALSYRYDAELAAREAGWACDRQELYDRRLAWRRAGDLLLSRGDAGFDAAFDRLESEAGSWAERFAASYSTKASAWDYAYADSLEAKLDWVADATTTANGAAGEAMLAMLGSDATFAARELDSFAVTGFDLDEGAYGAYERVVAESGLARIGESLEAWSVSANRFDIVVETGLAGGDAWDSGRVLASAAEFALSANERLAGIQAGIMASSLGRAIEEEKLTLYDRIETANQGFDDDMNGLFVADGSWRRDGARYGKDVVVHSTVGQAYITERVELPVFEYFSLSSWNIGDTLSESSLRGNGASIARARIAGAQAEVEEKGREVFGSGDEPGLFGDHIGTSPERLPDADPDDGIDRFFADAGDGELGRLMSSLIYWSVIEGRGWAEANKPIYDKSLWDDRGDWLAAPTLREVADVGVSVAAGLATGGIGAFALNLVDDALFGALDGLGGYTTWAEAGLSLGKKAVGALASYGTAGLFDGAIASVASLDTFGSGFGAALLSGTRGFTELASTGLVSSVGFDYADDGSIVGMSIDKERFKESVFGEGAIAGLIGGMAGAACGASMDYGGAFEDKLWSGFTDLASMAATEGAAYATHLAYSSSRGASGAELLEDAWAHSAGLSLNVASVGSLLGSAGFVRAVFGDGYDAASRMDAERVAGSLGAIGLSIHVGPDGVSGSFGGGGYDLAGIGASIVKGMALDASIGGYAERYGTAFGDAFETAYAFGDLAAEETVWRLVAGKDELRIDELGGEAVTVADASGNRSMTIGASIDDGGMEGMLDLVVRLQHEAWRNGLDDGVLGQGIETLSAVTAHTELAMRLAASSEHGGAMAALMMLDSTYGADALHYSNGGFAAYVAEAYDSIGDNWKLTMDGRLLNDGRARVIAEILNDDGSRGWAEVEGSGSETSTAAALVAYLGEERALELLGGSIDDISRYDDQTLQDVLGLDPVDIKAIRRSPGEAASVIAMASDDTRRRLIGEALMKDSGIVWDASARDGQGAWIGEGVGICLTDGEIRGSAAIRSIGGGAYERYSITSEVERGYGAYDAWKDGDPGSLVGGLNRLSYTKWDINSGEQLATLVAGGVWNTVDNSYGQLNAAGIPIGTDKRYALLDGPTIQANTIARGSFVSRWSFLGSEKFKGQDVMILSDTMTVAGERLDSAGKRVGHPYDARWLIHSTGQGSSDGCFVYAKTQSDTNYFEELMAQLKSWGLYQGYAITGTLSDESDFVYGAGYKEGTWQ